MKINPSLTLIFCLLLSVNSIAQPFISKSDNITKEEMDLQACDFEPDASALFLLNEQTISFKKDNYSTKTVYKRRARIKIFNENGFKYANVIIPNAKTKNSKIEDLEAFVYNLAPDGSIISEAVNKDQIFKDKPTKKGSGVDIRFTFPNLKAGSIIEYSYTRNVKNIYGIESWLLQSEIPVLTSVCDITIPAGYKLEEHIRGLQLNDFGIVTTTKRQDKYNISKQFVAHKIPAFRIEPFMLSLIDNLKRIEFSVYDKGFLDGVSNEGKWEFMSTFLSISPAFRNIYLPVKGTGTIIDSVKALDSEDKKISAIYDIVTGRVNWNGERFFVAEDITSAWENKSGSSAEINALILNLLTNVGIECKPVLASSREHGKINLDFPALSQFNSLVALVYTKDENYVVDGTEPQHSYKIPPLSILNSAGFVLDGNSTWIDITDAETFMISSTYIKAELDSSGMLRGKVNLVLKDYAKAERIKDMQKDKEEQQEETKDFLRYDDEDLVIDSVTVKDTAGKDQPLQIDMQFHYALTNNEDFYFLNPFFFSMFRKNPFTAKERRTDIDFGCKQKFITYILIKIPDNFIVEDYPKSTGIRTPDTSVYFRKDINIQDKQVAVRYNFELNNSLFAKESYPGIKEFFEKIYALMNQQIVLRKKN